jgi:hypothetical protein
MLREFELGTTSLVYRNEMKYDTLDEFGEFHLSLLRDLMLYRHPTQSTDAKNKPEDVINNIKKYIEEKDYYRRQLIEIYSLSQVCDTMTAMRDKENSFSGVSMTANKAKVDEIGGEEKSTTKSKTQSNPSACLFVSNMCTLQRINMTRSIVEEIAVEYRGLCLDIQHLLQQKSYDWPCLVDIELPLLSDSSTGDVHTSNKSSSKTSKSSKSSKTSKNKGTASSKNEDDEQREDKRKKRKMESRASIDSCVTFEATFDNKNEKEEEEVIDDRNREHHGNCSNKGLKSRFTIDLPFHTYGTYNSTHPPNSVSGEKEKITDSHHTSSHTAFPASSGNYNMTTEEVRAQTKKHQDVLLEVQLLKKLYMNVYTALQILREL